MSGGGYKPSYWDQVRNGAIDPPDCLGCEDAGRLIVGGSWCDCAAGQRLKARAMNTDACRPQGEGADAPIVKFAKATGAQHE